MTRFHVRPEAVSGGRVRFDAEETRHLSRVLRLRPGAVVRTVDGQGRELTVRLTEIGSRASEGDIIGTAVMKTESPLHLTLVQGLPKGEKFETIVRMATELGVSLIVPLVSERAVVRHVGPDAPRLRRWQRVAREAAKQSGRAVIPEVQSPVSLPAWLAETRPSGLLLCLWEGEARPLASVLPETAPERATVVVGPEGGFAEEEVGALRETGALVAGLGPRIVRTETAAPVALSLLQFRYGDLGR